MKAGNGYPLIIQGGMGVDISNWYLAQTVSRLGQLGTVSGVALEKIVARTLQRGDPGGHIRRALATFPIPAAAQQVLDAYYIPNGLASGQPYRSVPMFTIKPSRHLITLTVCANYAIVWLAKEGHCQPVSINYLEKIQLPHIYSIVGAMLAEVDFITMGAGIPLGIPAVIDSHSRGDTAYYHIPVNGSSIKEVVMSFNLDDFFQTKLSPLKKPGFLPIIASNLLATIFLKKLPAGSVYGFVVEEPTAGGHNAPPRGKPQVNESGEILPLYGEKDIVDYLALAKLGVPFWIGGSHASPAGLKKAVAVGAQGIQGGSIFALANESGMATGIRNELRRQGFLAELMVKTDMRKSPTNYPFKVAQLVGTIADQVVYNSRPRICDQSALISLYEQPNGKVGYRCPSEPVADYLRKGGKLEDTVGRACLCNGLISTTGFGNPTEPPIVTIGDDVSFLQHLMSHPADDYTAQAAICYLLGGH